MIIKQIEGITNKIKLRSYLQTGKSVDTDSITTQAHKFIQNKYWNRKDIFDIIPETKHKERLCMLTEKLSEYELSSGLTYDKYSELVKVFNTIESKGLYTKSGYEFTKYNIYTLTGRPSNSNNGINYAAMNKDDGTRSRFVSRFDKGLLIELDFDAYHLRLIAELTNYKFGKDSIHKELGRQYFEKENLTEEDYQMSKSMSFRLLYGGIPKNFKKIPFFEGLKDYIFSLWDSYKINGYIETPIYKRRLYKECFEKINPQKLFNYQIQAFETEANVEMMKDLLEKLNNYNSELVLYTYDSFLIDFDPKDGNDLIKSIKNSLKYPTSVVYGNNYNDLKTLPF
jgi:hypothetical protein|tara:strand:+ start:22753 stop:23772 length:1020 start_codon:yes stop_codon:yes gene_type:complete